MAYEIGWITGRHWHERGMVEELDLSDVVATPAAGIARDSTFGSVPLTTGRIGAGTVLITSTFSTAADTSLIVVSITSGNYQGTIVGPPTVAWTAAVGSGTVSTFTKQIEGTITTTTHSSTIWTATASTAISGRSITITSPNSEAQSAIAVSVDALTNTNASPIGTSSGVGFNSGTNAMTRTLGSLTTGSWVYVAGTVEDISGLTPNGSTTEDTEYDYSTNIHSAVGSNTTGTLGSSVTIGWTETSPSGAWGSIVALEILAA